SSRPMLRLSFGMTEAARLVGMSYWTLRFWCRRGWVPRDDGLSAWQVLVLAILNATNRGRGTGALYGDVAGRRAMEAVEGLDDALLVSENVSHDPYVAEAAAKIASEALPNEDLQLTDEMMADLARVLDAIDRKARGVSSKWPR